MAVEAEFYLKVVFTVRSDAVGSVPELRVLLRRKLHADVLEAVEAKVREVVDADPELQGVEVYYRPEDGTASVRRGYDDPVPARR